MKETDKTYEIDCELPGGIKKNDIKIDVLDNNSIKISGEKRERRESDDEFSHYVERRYGKFQRTLMLPRNADLKKM